MRSYGKAEEGLDLVMCEDFSGEEGVQYFEEWFIIPAGGLSFCCCFEYFKSEFENC